MKGDFSRLTFDPRKHFSGVRLQQGRVQLDADWNEQLDITAHRIATEITDFIGQSGTPEGNAGFEIIVDPGKLSKEDSEQLANLKIPPLKEGELAEGEFLIGRGRYYIDGMLFENEDIVPYGGQPDYPGAPMPRDQGIYLAYLDVWQHHITTLEDPSIREPALGGADTTTRTKNVWQVKLWQLGDPTSAVDRLKYLPPLHPEWERAISTGKLSARVSATRPTLENQLYRVEIHAAGPGKGTAAATFKWSRDNGSVAAIGSIADDTITLSAGSDVQTSFGANQWVEVTNEERTLKGEPGVLAELKEVNPDERKLMVVRWPGGSPPKLEGDVIVRRWDSAGDKPLSVTANGSGAKDDWMLLEDGIEITFETGADAYYKTGDYWLIPARTLTGKIDWPYAEPQPPHGIQHYYCGLALLTLREGKWNASPDDLRVIFKPLGTGLVSKGGDTINGTLTVDGATTLQQGLLVTGGNVGIGTPAPSAKLTVDPQGSGGLVIGNPNTSSGGYTSLSLSISAASGGHASIQSIRTSGQAYGDLLLNPHSNPKDGYVGVGLSNPVARLDIAQVARTGNQHPTAVKGLYVTGDFGASSDGVESRHTDGTQGIGFGYNTIYATGSTANQDLNLRPRGTGQVIINGELSFNSNSLPVAIHRFMKLGDNPIANTGYLARDWSAAIIGFWGAGGGGTPLGMGVYMYVRGTTWWIQADVLNITENWLVVDVMFIKRSWVYEPSERTLVDGA